MIDSSSSSVESSFRELDEAFLQTQTRIWLGEVLNIRLDVDLPISDLLQDGDILFEVSKVVWDLLLTKCTELRHLKHKYGPFSSKRSSGRYRPYSNVDSFLKICKILGLSGIDLFSPSDVVEKRNIRKVCICIRALSKKVRSKQLSVPDFDVVVCSVTMPTDMVGVIRRSLESSQCTLSSSCSYSSRKVSQAKPNQKKFYAQYDRDDDYSSSEESDEAESRYMGDNSFSSASKLDYVDGENSEVENSPEELKEGHYESDSVVGDSSCITVGENSYISDYLTFSDLMVHATDGSCNPVIPDGENNVFDFFLNVDSQGHNSDRRSFQNGSHRKFSDDEEMEVSSTTSMSSVVGRFLNLEFDDQFDEDDSSSANVQSSATKDSKIEKHYNDSIVLCEPPKIDTFRKNRDVVVADDNPATLLLDNDKDKDVLRTTKLDSDSDSDSGIPQYGDNNVLADLSSHISDATSDHLEFSCSSKSVDESERSHKQLEKISCIAQSNLDKITSENQHSLPVKDTNKAHEDVDVPYSIDDNTSSVAENGIQDKTEHDLCTPDWKKDTSTGKRSRRPLLKTVVKGTAIAGVLLLLLHIRKSKGNDEQEPKRYGQLSKYSGSKSWSTKQQKTSVGRGIYPSEKLKLGN